MGSMNKPPLPVTWLAIALHVLLLAGAAAAQASDAVVILQVEGEVQFSRRRSTEWDPAYTNQVLNAGDQVRTLARSRAVVQMRDLTLCRMGELSRLNVPDDQVSGSFGLLRGKFYFFHRAAPGTS